MRTIEKQNLTPAQKQLLQGIGAFILARSVPLLDLCDPSNGGSGVLLNLDDRYFVATAAHVIDQAHRFAILTREYNRKCCDFSGKYMDKRHDIGILELDSEPVQFLTELGHCFLNAEHLLNGRYPNPNLPIRVTGFPSQEPMRIANHRQISRSTTISKIAYGSLNYETFALPQSHWPKLALDSRRTQRQHDIFCSWDPNEDGMQFSLLSLTDEPKKHRFGPIALPGMSGGGLWIPFEDNSTGCITAPAALLAGIQTSYPQSGRGRWVRGTRTKTLIQLIERHYPCSIGEVFV
jgi:hypothetical protein